MTNAELQTKLYKLAELIHDQFQGDAKELAFDYACLLTQQKEELIEKHIAEIQEHLDLCDED